MKTKIEVTEVRPIAGIGNLKALVDVKLNGYILIRGFSVVDSAHGLIATPPRKVGRDGRWYEILTPLNASIQTRLEAAVLMAYQAEICAQDGLNEAGKHYIKDGAK